MTTYRAETEGFLQVDNLFYYQQIGKVIDHIEPQFEKQIKNYVFANLFFAFLLFVEIILLAAFFTTLSQSTLLAFALASIFLTIFCWAALRIYFQTKKLEQIEELKDKFSKSCKNLLGYRPDIPEHLFVLANAYCKFAARLEGKEYSMYQLPKWLYFLEPVIDRFSCWWHWKDCFMMREALLNHSIEEHVKLVRCDPTNLEIHTALANAYVLLSGLYVDPRKNEGYEADRPIPKDKYNEETEKKFRATAEKATEEFKILNDYAPNDPWVHSQLAYSYHDLQMPEAEIKEYEAILNLCPDDLDSLFKLGILYFQQGQNAKGLRVYEELKRSHYKRAEALLHFYGN